MEKKCLGKNIEKNESDLHPAWLQKGDVQKNVISLTNRQDDDINFKSF